MFSFFEIRSSPRTPAQWIRNLNKDLHKSGTLLIPNPPPECSPGGSHLPPLHPSTWKKPTMTKGLDFTKSATSSLLLNKRALWRICLLNQTTKAVDSTTSEERCLKEFHQNLPEFNEQKYFVLNPILDSISIFFSSQTPRQDCIKDCFKSS